MIASKLLKKFSESQRSNKNGWWIIIFPEGTRTKLDSEETILELPLPLQKQITVLLSQLHTMLVCFGPKRVISGIQVR